VPVLRQTEGKCVTAFFLAARRVFRGDDGAMPFAAKSHESRHTLWKKFLIVDACQQ
jgi:hypothetical protein